MTDPSAFHVGELAVQRQAGEDAIAARNISVLSSTVIAGARPFIGKQFMVALASVDAGGAVCSSLLFGKPGFLHTEDGSSITIDVPFTERDDCDALWSNVEANPVLGMLFIELGSRRRYRVNGTVKHLDSRSMEVAIREAYPNCPKYIQRRELRQIGKATVPAQAARGTGIKGIVESIVRQADTLFVASNHPETGADASHRGGNPGFIQVLDENTLRIPDFPGNSLFNTLGNFEVDPRAGLCIPDFEHNQLLQLSGTVSTLWDQDDPGNETGGTRRYWEFKAAGWVLRDTPQHLQWEYLDASPFNPPAPD